MIVKKTEVTREFYNLYFPPFGHWDHGLEVQIMSQALEG